MRHLALVILLAAIGAGLAGCSADTASSPPLSPGSFDAAELDDPCGATTTVTLFAGQTIDVGTVVVDNNNDSLCVTYHTTGDWYITETHLEIARTLQDIPQTKSGNPKVGNFEYAQDTPEGVQEVEFCFSLADLGYTSGMELYIAAHASVVRQVDGSPVQQETAWGDGPSFPGHNWAMVLLHTVQECIGEDPFTEDEFRTHTPAQWGEEIADCSASLYLEQIFGIDGCVQSLTVGCLDEGGYTVTLTGFDAIRNLLPTSGTPQPLIQDYTNPALTPAEEEDGHSQATEAGALLGEVVALALNVAADDCNPDFAAGTTPLGDLFITIPGSPFEGFTVRDVLAEANRFLGGCPPYFSYTAEELTSLLQAINGNFIPCDPPGSALCLTPGGCSGGGSGE